MKHIISTTNAPAAIGPYSQAIEANGTLYISGQIPVNPATGDMPEGIEAQARQVLDNIGAILKEAGMSYDDVVKTTVLLTNMADFAKVNEIYGSYFQNFKPARACYQVCALPKGALIEIEAIAVL